MSIEEKKAIVQGYMEKVLNNGDLTAIEKYIDTDNLIFNGQRLDSQQFVGRRQSILSVFPDFHLTVEDQICEADKVVTRVTFRGTHQGDLYGIPPTGRKVAYQGIAIDRISEGKVVESWHEADTWGMLKQLGVVPRLK